MSARVVTDAMETAGRVAWNISRAHGPGSIRSVIYAALAAAPADPRDAEIARLDANMTDLVDRRDELLAENERLREALKPFVAHWAKWMDDYRDDRQLGIAAKVTFRQLHAARAALEAKP